MACMHTFFSGLSKLMQTPHKPTMIATLSPL